MKDEDERRQIEAAMALLQSSPDLRLQITNLNKALFYLDLIALRDHGRTVSGARYLAYKAGPVIEDYKGLIKKLEAEGLAVQEDDGGMSKPVRVVRALEARDFYCLNEAERRLAARVAVGAAARSATGLSDHSHRNVGWQQARVRGESQPVNLRLALQQMMADDPWLDEPWSKEESDQLEAFGPDVAAR